jgi:hypothetical protein
MEDFERSAGGMDFDDDPGRDREDPGASFLEGGPDAILEELENMLPDSWREQIVHFPLTALAVGFGVGVLLGMKKGDEILTAGSAMLSAAATANLSQIFSGGD